MISLLNMNRNIDVDTFQDTSFAYYHLQPPYNVSKCDFQIKVTLRRVTRNTKDDPTIEKIIRWQERVNFLKNPSTDANRQKRIGLHPRYRIGEISMNNTASKDKGKSFFKLFIMQH